MVRTLTIALFSATLLAAACKKSEAPAAKPEDKAGDTSKPADPPKPADPAAAKVGDSPKPADPAAVKPGDPPKPADPAAGAAGGTGLTPELEGKMVTATTKMGDIFAAGAKDCEKLATDIKAFAVENKELIGQIKAVEKTLTPEQKQAFDTRHRGEQEAVMTKMEATTKACGENKNVQAAMAALEAD
jgi:hypothetical protein